MPLLTPTAIPSTGSLEVVGESHYQEGIGAMAAVGGAITALLVAEVGNPYDPRAVRVLLTNRYRAEKAGYLDSEQAAVWWPKLAELATHNKVAAGVARFVGGTTDRPSFGVWVDVVDEPLILVPLSVDVAYGTLAAASTGQSTQAPTPPGYYVESTSGQQRWWDGHQWGHYAPPRPFKESGTTYLLLLLLGGFAAHNFYLNRVGPAVGFLCVWWLGWILTPVGIGWAGVTAGSGRASGVAIRGCADCAASRSCDGAQQIDAS